ncbi:hypothetical protein [Paenibacillus faecalis]|uniref:hypothetical protein n=1 Tax=Paenibacillus faecalis TaxID=2079532 RepID=UPI000D0F5740|nr:hypothetical protein [Paenibacillus faecalis]
MDKWINSNPGKYYTINIFIQTIDPQEIVALSRELDDSKLTLPRESIDEKGWLEDLQPQTIDLIKFPDGAYAVSSGGNHRVF